MFWDQIKGSVDLEIQKSDSFDIKESADENVRKSLKMAFMLLWDVVQLKVMLSNEISRSKFVI